MKHLRMHLTQSDMTRNWKKSQIYLAQSDTNNKTTEKMTLEDYWHWNTEIIEWLKHGNFSEFLDFIRFVCALHIRQKSYLLFCDFFFTRARFYCTVNFSSTFSFFLDLHASDPCRKYRYSASKIRKLSS